MISLTHILILALVILIFSRPTRVPQLGRGLRDAIRNFKKAKDGESDIDVTDSVKHLEDRQD